MTDQDKIPTIFTEGKQRWMTNPLNGNTKPVVKIIALVAVSLTLAALMVSANWGSMFRESGVNSETLRATTVRIERNEAEIRTIQREFVAKEQYQDSQREVLRRLDRLEESNQQIIQMIVESRRKR